MSWKPREGISRRRHWSVLANATGKSQKKESERFMGALMKGRCSGFVGCRLGGRSKVEQ